MWLGTITCFQRNSPILYENVFPDFDPNAMCSIEGRFVDELPEKTKQTLRTCITDGRRATGMKFCIFIGVRMPSKDELKRKAATWNRSLKRQGERHDEFWKRNHEKEFGIGTTPYSTIEERIRNDRRFRKKLAVKVVNSSANYAPGQILLSKFCRMAYTIAIEKGEHSYENVGNRNRQATLPMRNA